MLDTKEQMELLEILENMEDEKLATDLLKEYGRLSTEWGKLVLNLDKNLSHEEWKIKCDEAKKRLDQVIKKIRDQS